MNSLPNEVRGEFLNDLPDFTAHEFERQAQRITFCQPRFVKAYFSVEAHVLFRLVSGKGQQFFACVQFDWWRGSFAHYDVEARTGRKADTIWAHRRHIVWSESASRIYQAHGQEQTVLVDVVELVDEPYEPVTSLVWLDTVERFESILPDSLYHSVRDGSVRLGRMSDWELCVRGDSLDQPTGEVVQRTTEAMQRITGDHWNTCGDGWNIRGVMRDFSSIRVFLDTERVEIGVPEFRNSGVELLDVLLGPIQFL